MALMSEVQLGISMKKLIIELIFQSVGDASLRQPREFYGRLDADFYVTPPEEREQK